jgi:hypothetical protein
MNHFQPTQVIFLSLRNHTSSIVVSSEAKRLHLRQHQRAVQLVWDLRRAGEEIHQAMATQLLETETDITTIVIKTELVIPFLMVGIQMVHLLHRGRSVSQLGEEMIVQIRDTHLLDHLLVITIMMVVDLTDLRDIARVLETSTATIAMNVIEMNALEMEVPMSTHIYQATTMIALEVTTGLLENVMIGLEMTGTRETETSEIGMIVGDEIDLIMMTVVEMAEQEAEAEAQSGTENETGTESETCTEDR